MAGIYINGMHMPESGFTSSIKICWTGEVVMETPAGWEIVATVIPVPDHGRLIEAERLKEVFHRNVVGGDAFDQLIDIAPTVLPADREGE